MDRPVKPHPEPTLLDWACRRHPETPRKRIKEWIADGRFRLDGEVVTQSGLRMGDPGSRLQLGAIDAGVAAWAHRKRIHPKLTVLHLDASLAVVEKQAGLLSVPVEGQNQPSAQDLLLNHLNDARAEGLRRRLFGKFKAIPLPVHRLDQYTSGLLCFAMNPEARASLIEQVRSRSLLREYIAFADGELPQPSGIWRDLLKLDPTGYRQMLAAPGDPEGTEAVTRFETMEVFSPHHVSKLRIRLETGLKHQIRIQSAVAGVPLLGDRLYHDITRRLLEKGGKAPFGVERQALHAAVLGVKHPEDGRELCFESRLPPDLSRLEERLRGGKSNPPRKRTRRRKD